MLDLTFPLQGRTLDGIQAGNHPVFAEVIDLAPYVNSSAVAVQESFSLERTYTVFRTMGLRHLVVVDKHNHVKGVVTRKVSSGLGSLCTAPPAWHRMTNSP